MAQMASVFSELERKMIARRTTDALAAFKANGRRLGRPVDLSDDVRARIEQDRAKGLSLRAIADGLTAEGIPTARGGAWHASTVRAVLGSLALDADIDVADNCETETNIP